ncbi:hypothetical protein B296_00018169 [Ensete ventricosum]|uniref:HMA domain-containing protein n=1 Tax=Ensete ventricosum TaxID=4639 RepID=A0A427AKN6_ENSVE|nr:hypothetical protein B296_00018169 [Ensete ventricosum]
MKGVNFHCASPASAAICTSVGRRSMVRGSTGRAIDRHTPHLRDPRRAKAALNSVPHAPTGTKSHFQTSRESPREPTGLSSPPGSSRCLPDDNAFDVFPSVGTAAPVASADPSSFQVKMEVFSKVVHLRVSLHCKCCERKVRKHVSKMEGESTRSTSLCSWFSTCCSLKDLVKQGYTNLGKQA